MRVVPILAAVPTVCLLGTGVAFAGPPGTDGGPAQKGCEPVIKKRYYVGATKISCGKARRVAKRAIRGNAQKKKWRCTGVGTGFGHCHRRGNSKKIAHWAVND